MRPNPAADQDAPEERSGAAADTGAAPESAVHSSSAHDGVAALMARDPAFAARMQAAAREAKVLAAPGSMLQEAARHQREGNLNRAAQLLDRVLERAPANQPALVQLGAIRRGQGKLYESLLLYQRALKADSRNAAAHGGLGKTFLELGWLQTAEAHLRLALESNPGSVEALIGLGGCLLEQGRPREAIVVCQEAILLAPDSEAAHRILETALAGTA